MKKHKLDEFTGNWIIGNFSPSLLNTENFEVGIKKYLRGEINPEHYHKLCCEFTIVLYGVIEMNGEVFYKDDIVEIAPFEKSTFKALTDCKLCVVKTASFPLDKHLT